jgi:hypothetical protein
MARQATGQVVIRERAHGRRVYGLRFRAYGERQYVTVGSDADGWTRERAEVELQNVRADVRRGSWRSAHPDPAPEPVSDPTFHEFSSQWFEANEGVLAAKHARRLRLAGVKPSAAVFRQASAVADHD